MKHELEPRNYIVIFLLGTIFYVVYRNFKINPVLLFLLFGYTVYILNFVTPKCGQEACNQTMLDDDGYGYIENFLSFSELERAKEKFTQNKNYIGNTTIIDINDDTVNIIREKISQLYKQELYIDYAFIRYYDGKAVNPFENMHFDSAHYDTDVVQIRALVNLYDRSNGTFTYESRCCNKGTIEKPTKENTLSIIQANKLKHSYKYNSGERIVLVVDLVTSKRKGLHGAIWGTFDYVWDRVQKFITSFSLS